MLELAYLHYESVRRRLAEFAAEITGEEFAAGVTLAGTVPSANYAAFAEAVRDLTSGSTVPQIVTSDD